MPHVEDWFNSLEIFVECFLIIIVYVMFGFLTSDIQPLLPTKLQWSLGYVIVSIIVLIFTVILICMVNNTIKRLKYWLRKRKYRKTLEKRRAEKLNMEMKRNSILDTCDKLIIQNEAMVADTEISNDENNEE